MQAGSYQVEPELMQGTPRKVRYKKGIRTVFLWLRLLLGFLLGLMLLLAVVDLKELTALHAEGKTIPAYVTGKMIQQHQGGQTHYLDFAFQVNGISYKGMDRVPQAEWEEKQAGSPIPVIYLPSNPNVHRIGMTVDAKQVEDRWRFWIVLGLFTLVLLGGGLGGAQIGLRRERELLRKGVAVPAEIISGVPIINSQTAARRVTFRYAVSPTETKSKTILMTAVAANHLAGQRYVTALYDPARPDHARLYSSLQSVELT